MARKTPTLGYASRTEAAVALKAEGLTEMAIAHRIGVSRNSISGLLYNARCNDAAPQISRAPSRGNEDTLAAKRAGIMLSHDAGRVDHRETSYGTCRVVEVRLNDEQFGRLVDQARKARATPAAHATALVLAGLERA